MIVALSEDIGSDKNSELLSSEFHLRSINDLIKGTSFEDPIDKEEIESEETASEDLMSGKEKSGWTEWANSIFESAEIVAAEATSGSVVNAFYNPQIAKKLKGLISYLPLWTAVMHSHFRCDKEVATSTAVEAAFADLKYRTFKGELPMRVDKFIVRHIDWLHGKVLLSMSNTNNMTHVAEESVNTENMWDAVENWLGLTKKESNVDETDINIKKIDQKNKKGKKRKSTYLDDCPNWDNMPTLQRITIPLLKNGSLLKGSRCDDQFVVVRETCAFDSLTQVVTNAIVTHPTYAGIITTKNNNFCNFAKNISLINKNITSNIYQQRTKILLNVPIFETKPYRRNIIHLNTNCNVSHLAEYLFADFPSLTINRKCEHCNRENVRNIPVLSVNVNMLLQNGLSDIQNAVLDTNQERQSMCRECNQIIIEKYNFKTHLLIDCSVFTDERYAASIGIVRKNAILDSVPKYLQFSEQQYIVAGAVSYHQYASNKNDGHYTAYIYDTINWYMYDNMLSKRRVALENEKIEPHLIIYVAK